MKTKQHITLLFSMIGLILFPVFAFAGFPPDREKPTWTDYKQRKAMYPNSTYVVGFCSEEGNSYETRQEIMDRIKGYARTQLVESIHVTIKSMTTTNVITENQVTSDFFKKTSVSLSNVNISGLIEENYYDEDEDVFYAFAFAKKAEISDLYRKTIANKKETVAKKLADAARLAETDKQQAMRTYYECFPLFRDIEEAQTLILAFENCSIEAPHLFYDLVREQKMQVSKGIKSLQTSENLSIEDVCAFMAQSLKIQLEENENSIRLTNFTFEDSKMASAFSRRFGSLFEQKLIGQNLDVLPTNSNLFAGSNSDLKLGGTYWKEGENLRIIAIVRDPKTGKALASTEAELPIAWLDERDIKYKPNNYNQAVSDNNILQQDQIVSSNLVIDLLTNHGRDNLIYTEGEILKLYLQANKECYVRFIYHLADGSKVLLLDNYHIGAGQVNRLFELPYKFECYPPFGVEVLQLNAQTKPFKPLNVRRQSGYSFIADDMEKILENVRGFKPVDDSDGIAEKRLTITTLPK